MPPLSIFEETIRRSIIIAEAKALKNTTQVTPRSLGNVWERIWWEYATKAGMPLIEAEKQILPASLKFTDYCKYDISTEMYATTGLDIPFQVDIDRSILAGSIDMIKVPINDPDNQIFLIDFTRKNVKNRQLAGDIAVLSTVYAFREFHRDTTYMCIDLSENKEKLEIVSSSFDRDDIKEIERTVRYLVEGIRRGVNYKSDWICKECAKCDFK